MIKTNPNGPWKSKLTLLPWAGLLILFVLASCQSASTERTADSADGEKDLFPDKVEIKHSIGFDVSYHNHYKLLHIFRHYNDEIDTLTYTLLQKGSADPELGNPVITLPVENIVSLSTTHLGFFNLLEAFDQLKGVETVQYVSSPTVKDMVESGQVKEMSPAGALNVESVINEGTEVVMAVGYPNSQNEIYQQLERVGIPVLLNADWQELDLLGRAEWVKLLAVLINKEKMVNERFGEIEAEYEEILSKVASIPSADLSTITGIAIGDAWHVSGGRSFAANLLKLVKADYPWMDENSTGSLKLDFETVYEQGLTADIWMVPGSAKSKADVLQRDTRYADFKAFKNNNIYNIFGRHTPGGGNDYYEQGVIEPQVILKDIVKIFHPSLLPDHELVYHAQLQ